ncbi:MAG: hypothetical protein ACK5HL_01410 [Bacilli bacterium]
MNKTNKFYNEIIIEGNDNLEFCKKAHNYFKKMKVISMLIFTVLALLTIIIPVSVFAVQNDNGIIVLVIFGIMSLISFLEFTTIKYKERDIFRFMKAIQ